MSQPTQGPWEVAVPQLAVYGQLRRVCRCGPVGDERADPAWNQQVFDEALANARLIAAAPALLAACKAVVASCHGDPMNEAARDKRNAALYQATAAIAAAEGQG